MANRESNANTFFFDDSNDDAALKQTPAYVGRLVITDVGTGATVIVYDNNAASGNIIWTWATADGRINQEFDMRTNVGLFVAITGTTPKGFITWT